MKRFFAAIALIALSAMLPGCETMDKTWESTWGTTQEYYKDYINPDPVIDYEAKDWTSSEAKLAELFTSVDKPVDLVGIYLNRKDSFPEDAWIEKLFASYPWISGLAVVSLQGDVVLQRPETGLKPLNVAPAVAYGQEMVDRRLRSYVDMTPLGPELYLVTGMFKGNELAGAIIVHFDIRNVVNFCPNPGELVIATPEDILWAGSDDAAMAAVKGQPWNEILVDQSSGRFTDAGREYIWLTRYLGDHKLVYATTAMDDGEEDSSFSFFGLF